MNAAYVGILTPGSTSLMRAEWLQRLTPDWHWDWIDTDPPLQTSPRIWRSLAFRAKTGPSVRAINETVNEKVRARAFDLVWVDKGVFLRDHTVQNLRGATRKLVHFTPDTAFHENRSAHFERALDLYDLLVTTKSFEIAEYRRHMRHDSVFLTTQGFDPLVHRPLASDNARRREAVFIGLAEPDREKCISLLLEKGVSVRLGGRGWSRVLRAWGKSDTLHFEGEDVFGDDYAALLSGSWIGLGLLSKRFPELHTTRTFEIPACGAVLATPENPETATFFTNTEALFFRDHVDLADRVKQILEAPDDVLSDMSAAGRHRVNADGRDYPSILSAILGDSRVRL